MIKCVWDDMGGAFGVDMYYDGSDLHFCYNTHNAIEFETSTEAEALRQELLQDNPQLEGKVFVTPTNSVVGQSIPANVSVYGQY